MSKLTISAKCSDGFWCKYEDNDGLTAEHQGYVPTGIGIDDDSPDYVGMEIDTETGQILNWKKLKKFQVLRAMQEA
jgi:hypothetical protein